MTPREKQNAKARAVYAAKREALVSGLGAYATHKNRTVEQWLQDCIPAREYMKKLPK
jgi:hypothetical protein